MADIIVKDPDGTPITYNGIDEIAPLNTAGQRELYSNAQGTIVKVAGVSQSEVNFDADPQSQITANSNAINDKASKTALENAVNRIAQNEDDILELRDEAGNIIDLVWDNQTEYKLKAELKNKDGVVISTSSVIDLPLESVVVSGRYENKKIILTLENGSEVEIPVADLVAGLQSEITATNKLSSDLVDDTDKAHKFVSASEKEQITLNKNNKLDKITTPTVDPEAYIKKADGTQGTMPITLVGENAIAQYDSNGCLHTNPPTLQTHCVRKIDLDATNLLLDALDEAKLDIQYAPSPKDMVYTKSADGSKQFLSALVETPIHSSEMPTIPIYSADKNLKTSEPVEDNDCVRKVDLDKKADKVASATANDLASLDTNGNLTDSGIAKDKVEQVETIYDMTSTDANINWGYTSGIPAYTQITGKDFTKYKYLRIYVGPTFASENYYSSCICDLRYPNLSNPVDSTYVASNIMNMLKEGASTAFYDSVTVFVNKDKTSIRVGTFRQTIQTSWGINQGPTCLIEGVY